MVLDTLASQKEKNQLPTFGVVFCFLLRTGDNLQVDEAALGPSGVAGCAHILPRHVAAQVV